MLHLEEWRWIPGYEGRYKAGSLGSVKSYLSEPTGRLLKLQTHHSGYASVSLLDAEGRRLPQRVHRLVLLAFRGEPVGDANLGCHRNGIRTDNRLENLYWGTHAENMADKVRHGTDNRGERNHTAILTEAQVVEIRERIHAGKGTIAFKDLAEEYSVYPITIGQIARNKTWKHAGGPDCSDVPRFRRGPETAVTMEEAQQILDVYIDGATQQELADAYSISAPTVSYIINRNGAYAELKGREVKRKHRSGGPKGVSHDEAVEIRRLYSEDRANSMPKIAKRFGVSTATVGYIVKSQKKWAYLGAPAPRAPRLALDRAQELRDAYVGGEKQGDLATRYGVPISTVRAAIHRTDEFACLTGPDVAGGTRNGRSAEVPDATAREIRSRYVDGEASKRLAADYDVSLPTIHNILGARAAYAYLGESVARR